MRPLKELIEKSQATTAEDFAQLHPHPALILKMRPSHELELKPSTDSTISTFFVANAENLNEGLVADWLVWLVKSNRNRFADIVILGRSSISDIFLPIPTVSSIHASFTKIGKSWRVVHRGATNGVMLNGKAIESETYAPLKSGDRLEFGPDVSAEYFAPEHIYAALHKYSS